MICNQIVLFFILIQKINISINLYIFENYCALTIIITVLNSHRELLLFFNLIYLFDVRQVVLQIYFYNILTAVPIMFNKMFPIETLKVLISYSSYLNAYVGCFRMAHTGISFWITKIEYNFNKI